MKLEDALLRIEELEKENEELRAVIKEYESRKYAGRKKHDEKWMKSYNDFALLYEDGKSIMEIVEMLDFSRRTAYRYKEYYDRMVNRDKN